MNNAAIQVNKTVEDTSVEEWNHEMAVNLGGVQIHRQGTLIGKALEPLEKGKGEILVLLSLQ